MNAYDQSFLDRFEKKLQKALQKEERSFLGFFIKNYRFTYLIIFGILLAGFFAVATLPREANPEVKIPIAVVATLYPGASPVDVEELVTNEIEDKVKNLDDLRRYTSTSGLGLSSVVVEFEADADLKESFQKLRDAVDTAKPQLPDAAEDPEVVEIRFEDEPIVTYSLVGDLSDTELKRFADLLQDEFEGIRSVSKVEILGAIEREFQVVVDQTRLAGFNISLSQVVGAIARNNVDLPVGTIDVDGFNYNVRVVGQSKEADTLNDIVITTVNETPIYIRDVAQVTDTFRDRTTESRIGFPPKESASPNQGESLGGDQPGAGAIVTNTVSLQVFKKTGGNILNIVTDTQDRIAALTAEGALPATITIEKTNDNSVFIRDDLNRLGKSGIQTMILIVLILFAVLGLRSAVITGLSVPIAFLMAFIIIMIQGSTINSLVLFSLVLSLGLMVDNSIVIMEGINEYMKTHNKTAYQAALLSVWNYKWPIIAGTLTTVSAFLPMLLVSGILGQFLRVLPITISATLLSSLFVALVILPTLAARKVTVHARQEYERKQGKKHWFTSMMDGMKAKYTDALRSVLPVKKKRRKLLGTAWLLFVISVLIPVVGLMRIEMFPPADVDFFVVQIELPAGSVLEQTSVVAAEAEKIVLEIPELDNFVTTLGASSAIADGGGGGGSSSSEHLGNIIVNLVADDERDRKSYEIVEDIREELEAIRGGRVLAEELTGGPPTGAPIEVRITGNDTESLIPATEAVAAALRNIEGVINVQDNMETATGEFAFSIDRERADYYGLDVVAAANTLRTAVFGIDATTLNIDGDDVDIVVKYDTDKLTSADDLEQILITTPLGEQVSIKQLADVSLEPSLLSIRHRDGKNTVSVTADIETGVNLQTVLATFEQDKAGFSLPQGVQIEVGGEVEDIEQSLQETFLSMVIAVILITFILVLQFNSFRQPFIILFALPLALPGVIIGLNLLRAPLSFAVFIGIVSLSGIVVNDAIVLIDKVNKNLKNGMSFVDGIVEGGIARMQPILLTSLTTIAGIFPLIFADEFWRGLSYTIIFGLLFSTILTLVIVPVMYAGMCKDDKCFDE